MILSDATGNHLRLKIRGYQFPDAVDVPYDSNWLNVEIAASHAERQWDASSPCLLTYELAELATWFESISCASSERSEIFFMEPNLTFKLLNATCLRVVLAAEFAPTREDCTTQDVALDFAVTSCDLAGIATSLEKQLAPFPQRTKR